MNAILYINKTGCQWRLLPREFGPWQTVYYYFRKWKLEGVFEDIMDTLHSLARKLVGRNESPSMGIIDSRSVKTSHHADSSCKGIDGNKKNNFGAKYRKEKRELASQRASPFDCNKFRVVAGRVRIRFW